MMSKSKANDEKVKQFRRSKPMERVLLEILVDEASKGNKPSSTFKPSSITRVVNTINEKFSVCCEPDHVENHLKTVKSNWKTIQTVHGKSGFSWDDKLKMVVAGKNEFDQYVLVHPSHEKYLNKMIDMYDEMVVVVGRDIATGSFAKQFGDIDATEVDSSPVDLGDDFDDFDELMKGSKTCSSIVHLEKRSHKRRKGSNNDDKYVALSTQLGEMASTIKSLAHTDVDHSQVYYSQLYNEMMKVDGYDEITLGSVFDHLIENEKIGKTFMVKSATLCKVWVDKFLSKGDHH
ncbi:hypothetical protein ACJRO7_011998 [Eucalyptus globulus]|uniref:Myb/SANT-like domain-containing protein n=1 Tax=Eucalyptus globulus TaxID=34317 RepID=A0ABD3LH53_EUCGL